MVHTLLIFVDKHFDTDASFGHVSPCNFEVSGPDITFSLSQECRTIYACVQCESWLYVASSQPEIFVLTSAFAVRSQLVTIDYGVAPPPPDPRALQAHSS